MAHGTRDSRRLSEAVLIWLLRCFRVYLYHMLKVCCALVHIVQVSLYHRRSKDILLRFTSFFIPNRPSYYLRVCGLLSDFQAGRRPTA